MKLYIYTTVYCTSQSVRCTVAVLTLQHTATDRSDDQTIRYALSTY